MHARIERPLLSEERGSAHSKGCDRKLRSQQTQRCALNRADTYSYSLSRGVDRISFNFGAEKWRRILLTQDPVPSAQPAQSAAQAGWPAGPPLRGRGGALRPSARRGGRTRAALTSRRTQARII